MVTFTQLKYMKIDNVSDLCRFCGISRQQFYNIKEGRCEPSVYTALAIAEYLKLDIHYLFKIYTNL